jgi:nucleotide-binding universal stress UspA family protein
MFEKILVPTDFSEKSRSTLNVAAKMADCNSAVIYLFHVIETIADTPFEEFSEFYLRLERRAQSRMKEWMQRDIEPSIAVEPIIVFGSRYREILKFSETHGIDLIVMHSHTVTPQDPAGGWGTISYRVALLAKCPVMLVK